jgi:redox-sensitive bicupin YhaK (pirin superfamily)
MALEIAATRPPKGDSMIDVRPFNSLGHANHGWLNARHHFSFASYFDPKRVEWGALRVWNDDEIAPNTGFPPHPHADRELITYVREGADARVLGATLKAGESVEYVIGAGRHGYLVPALGSVEVNGVRINTRDGAAIADVETVKVTALEDSEIVLVDSV